MQISLIFIAYRNGDETKENFEWSVSGRKANKERVTINACSNTTGMVKMPLQVIGKANRVAIMVVDHVYQLFT